MLTTPSGLTDAHRPVFYRLVVLDAALRHRPPVLPSGDATQHVARKTHDP